MAFEGLAEKLQQAFRKLSSHGKLTESDVKTAMRDVRMALLEADVNYKVVKDFIAKVTERAFAAGHQDSKRGTDRADGRPERAPDLLAHRAHDLHAVRSSGRR